MVLGNVEPKKVMQFFEELESVPRPSKHEKKVSDFLLAFAKERNLEAYQDEFLNIIIKKPATSGYENVPAIILQGHMDMVPEANEGVSHDFETDPIQIYVDGNLIRAKGTTLGADNGIAVAMMMALCDAKDIHHPALEMLITADEEEGMSGASQFDPKKLSGKRLINLDTEEEGQIYISCAGGIRTELSIPYKSIPLEGDVYALSIKGLLGGHSAIQAMEQRANAHKLLARSLNSIQDHCSVHLISFVGGSKENAIPRESTALIAIKSGDVDKIKNLIQDLQKTYRYEFAVSDPGVLLELKPSKSESSSMMDVISTAKVVDTITLHPNGIHSMSLSIPGLVQTSLNVGVIRTTSETVAVTSLLRSSVSSEINMLVQQVRSLCDLIGGTIITADGYAAWEYRPQSPLRDIAVALGKDVFGEEIKLKAIHAGLECGIISEKFGHTVDIISIGPNINYPHSPDENIEIASVQKTYQWLLKILAHK